jgi:lipopolysaccharide/colanic/teichoic acid biosynthesis glycosyltransferase
MIYKRIFKRPLDLFGSFLLLIILSPVIIVMTIILSFTNSGNPFFIQARPGLHGKNFFLIKFKTMNDKKDESGKLKPDEKRMTRFGNMIRNKSIDEIPQFINVLKGDMSLVGPRPLLIEYMQLYNDFQRHRHDLKPGITGLAQIKGRNELSWEQKFEYDVWYVENVSFLLDCEILIKTVGMVFKSNGISSGTSVTMEKFKGN